MKKTHLALVLLLGAPAVHSQDILWEQSYGGRHAEHLSDLQPTADYGFIIGGSSLSDKSGNKSQAGSGDLDYWIWKMDEHGGAEWQKGLGGGASDLLRAVRTTHDGGFLLAGTSNSPKGHQKTVEGHGGNDYWVVKLDARGDVMWQKCFGGIGQDDLQSVVATRDGGYLLAGSSNSSAPALAAGIPAEGLKKDGNRGSMDYWLVKIDADGNEQWQRTYGGQYADHLRDAAQTRDGGFIIAGASNSPASGDKARENFGQGSDFWILKLDQEGHMEWQQSLGGSGDDQPQAILQSADLGYVVAGSSNSQTRTSKKGTDLWVVKLDALGEPQWEQAYDIGSVDLLTSLVENPDGTMLVGSYSPASPGDGKDAEGLDDYVAIKLSAKGEELWRRTMGSEGEDILKKVVLSRDGGYLLAGTSNPESRGHAQRRKDKKKGLAQGLDPLDNTQQLAGARKAQQELDNRIQDAAAQVNDVVGSRIDSATGAVNDAMGRNNDSAFKVGVDSPVGDLLNPSRSAGGNPGGKGKGGATGTEHLGPKPGARMSRDKKTNYGGKDFWVVKLKDREKPLADKLKIEAIPNPVVSYTNVIVGFDFDNGTARLYDMGGRELQKFPVEGRTVPVNLSGYPVGVYIVQVTTNKGEASVKLIKNSN